MATTIQTPEQFEDCHFPKAGIDLSMPVSQQTPRQISADEWARTTPVGVNVRAYEPATDRARGGSRSGMERMISTPVVAGWIIQHLEVIVTSAPNTLRNGLLAFWSMDDTPGAQRVDASGHGHTLVNHGLVDRVTGKINYAASFPGNNGSYLSLASAPVSTQSFSVSLWFKTSTNQTTYFWEQDNGTARKQGVGLTTAAGGTLRVYIDRGTFVTLLDYAGPFSSDWHHVVAVSNAASLRLYLDGVYVATNGNSVPIIAVTKTCVGADVGGTSLYTGSLDLLGLWSRVLTDGGVAIGGTAAGEVAQLYNAGAGLDYGSFR